MNATEVKIEMLNKALPMMIAYQSDIVYDFESIDEMKDGYTAYWVIRKTGTHFTSDVRRLEGYRKYAESVFIIHFENGVYTLTADDSQNR